MNKVRVLFVCMGNICRSPTAHGVFRDLVRNEGLEDRIEIDSAGTHGYHIGAPPDGRAQATAKSRGFDLSDLRARKAITQDFEEFHYILAMDEDNYQGLKAIAPADASGRLQLFLDYAPDAGLREVPDPYYGGQQGFEQVFDLVTEASEGLLAHIRKEHGF